jgi:TPR repeat protein
MRWPPPTTTARARPSTRARRSASIGSPPSAAARRHDGRWPPCDKPATAAPGQQDFDEGVRLYKAGQQAAAAKLFLPAAEQGNARAQLQIGYQYNYGEGVPVNAAEAVKWYRRAAEQGDAAAESNLGGMYEDGKGVPEDWVEAARWYGKAAEANSASGRRPRDQRAPGSRALSWSMN